MAAPGLSKKQKQLLVLLLSAAWIVVALFLALEEAAPGISHGVLWSEFRVGQFILQGIVWSAPALLFGGIFFWWLGRK